MKIFQILGEKIDSVISWLFIFKDNDLQLLIWNGLVAALLVFVIEYLRIPRIKISFLDCGFDFKLPECNSNTVKCPDKPNSKNWKFEVRYRNSFLSKLLFRYPLSNLKAKISIYDISLSKIKEFQAKPDFNPNVYQERDVSPALTGINLTKGEFDRFPFINKSERGWLAFDVWEVFLCQERMFLSNDVYFMKVNIISDQNQKVAWAKFILSRDSLNFQKISLLEKLKLKFI